MQGTVQLQHISLGVLSQLFSQDDRTSVFLVDTVGNSYTFFKYKAKLIDVAALKIAVGIGQKSKQDAIQQIRKGFTYGIKSGDSTIFYIGQGEGIQEFMKDAPFWDPKNLFRPPNKMDSEWYRSKVMKPTDKDMFGNEGTLYPSESYRIFVSTSREIKFQDLDWLKGTEEFFIGKQIQ